MSFREPLVHDGTKCVSINDVPCKVRTTIIDLDSVELKYYTCMISLDKCGWSCNALSTKVCVPIETTDIHAEGVNMLSNKNRAEAMMKHTSCHCKCKCNSTTCNSCQKWINGRCQCYCK